MERIEKTAESVKILTQGQLRAMMIVWEEIEDGYAEAKARIAMIFLPQNRLGPPQQIIERVTDLPADQGATLPDEKREELETIAENLAGVSIDYFSYKSIKGALGSRLIPGKQGTEVNPAEPLTAMEFEGLTKLLIGVVFNTLGKVQAELQANRSDSAKQQEIIQRRAKGIGKVLSLQIWQSLLIQKPNVITAVRYILDFMTNKFPSVGPAIRANMSQESSELQEALFGNMAEATEENEFSSKETDTLRIAMVFIERQSDILQARQELLWYVRELLGERYGNIRSPLEKLISTDALKEKPRNLFGDVLALLQTQNRVLQPDEETALRGLVTKVSAVAIDFALAKPTQRAVRSREDGGELGLGKDATDPLLQEELEGLLQNAALVLFSTQTNAREKIRSPELTQKQFVQTAEGIANQLARPRWKPVLLQAPEIIYVFRTAINMFPRAFRREIQRQLRAKGSETRDMEEAVFGRDEKLIEELKLAA